MNKKIKFLIALAIFAICVFVPVHAFAAEPAVEGSEFTVVKITIDEPIIVISGGVDIQYDPAVLEIYSAKWLLDPAPMLATIDKVNNKGVFAYAEPTEVYGDVLYVTFKIINPAAYTEESVNTDFQIKAKDEATGGQVDVPVGEEGGFNPDPVWNEHDFIEKVHNDYIKIPATCTEKATYYKSCSICGTRNEETFVGGNLARHTYDREVATSAYLKEEANCQSPAVYYKSCACGEKGTATFEYGSVGSHNYNEETVASQYLVSEATCTTKAVYKKSCVCGAASDRATFQTGSTLAHSYTQEVAEPKYLKSAANCSQKAVYYKSCTCGAKGTTTFEYGSVGTHNYDREVVAPQYLVSAATCTAKAVYKKSCVCGLASTDKTFESGNALGHTGGTATCDTQKVCIRCGQSYGSTAHTYNKNVVNDAYLAEAATCTSNAKYYLSCVCGARGASTFEGPNTKLPHTYDKEIAADNTLVSAATCTAKAVYKKSCSCGAISDTATFESGELASHAFTNEKPESKYLKSEATCQKKAVYNKSCACGEAGQETFEHGNVAAHDMVENGGVKKCKVCGKSEGGAKKSGGINTTTIIIIAACACGAVAVAGVVVVIVASSKKAAMKAASEGAKKASKSENEDEE